MVRPRRHGAAGGVEPGLGGFVRVAPAARAGGAANDNRASLLRRARRLMTLVATCALLATLGWTLLG